MSHELAEREKSLKISNEKLAVLNKNYLDLVGFVSHELKGILSSIVLNTYNLKHGLLGPINDAQRKTLRSISRNLDYLSSTVKNFLSLSRIEKDEMALKKTRVNLRENVFDISIEAFQQLANDKGMTFENTLDPQFEIMADIGMIQIVANNLVSNAVKYGKERGRIRISGAKNEGIV